MAFSVSSCGNTKSSRRVSAASHHRRYYRNRADPERMAAIGSARRRHHGHWRVDRRSARHTSALALIAPLATCRDTSRPVHLQGPSASGTAKRTGRAARRRCVVVMVVIPADTIFCRSTASSVEPSAGDTSRRTDRKRRRLDLPEERRRGTRDEDFAPDRIHDPLGADLHELAPSA